MEGKLRLSDGQAGPGYEYGRLDIFLRGVWRSVCDEFGFGLDEDDVACSGLGYGGGAALKFRQATEQVLASTIPIGLTGANCAGNETSLLQCSSVFTDLEIQQRRLDGIRFDTCARIDAFGTSVTTDSTVLACGDSSGDCPDPVAEQGAVRLVGASGTPCDPVHAGFVEIFNSGEWGSIFFGRGMRDNAFADVVCRQLGLPHGTVIDQTSPPEVAADGECFWLSLQQVRCLGPEARVLDCDVGQGFREDNAGCRNDPLH